MASIEGCSLALPFIEGARSTVDLAAIVDAYSTLLFRVANSVLRSRTEAEDVVQDVFLRVLEHRLSLSTVRDMRVWLIRIAWNLALDRKRRKRPEQLDEAFARSLAGATMPADTAMEEAQRLQAVLREIERLPKAERHVLLLSAIEELGTAEIAGRTGTKRVGGAGAAVTSAGDGCENGLKEKRPMRDAEETIERLLAGLRDAEPPAGIQRRILEALEGMDAREASTSASLWRRPLRPALAPAVGVYGDPGGRFYFSATKTCPWGAARPLRPTFGLNGAPTFFIADGWPEAPEGGGGWRVRLPRRLVSRVTARRPHDGPAVRETQSASFPAPPLPLTEQERLLLRLAHRWDAETSPYSILLRRRRRLPRPRNNFSTFLESMLSR